MTVALLFRGALGPQPGGSVTLRFGSTGSPPVEPPVVGAGALRLVVAAPWARAAQVAQRAPAPWSASASTAGSLRAPWQRTTAGTRGSLRTPWARTTPTGNSLRAPWGRTTPLERAWLAPWARTTPLERAWLTPWDAGLPAAQIVRAPWDAGLPAAQIVRAPWDAGVRHDTLLRAPWQIAAGSRTTVRAPWDAGLPTVSHGGPVVGPVTPPPTGCWAPEPGAMVTLVFGQRLGWSGTLLFSCFRASAAVVPIREVYVITNTTSLVRVADGVQIPALSFSLSLDADSYAWGFRATVPLAAISLLEPAADGEPVVLEATVNGFAVRVVAEALSRERAFGQASATVTGRGITAALDSPYAPTATFESAGAATSQQLAESALPFGWDLDWGLTPWLVPGGLWSHTGTPISAVIAVAAAAGGYVQPHPTLQRVLTRARYPVAPWAWAGVTPDLELPAAVVQREGIEWTEKARYNAVYVSGTSDGGVSRLVKRMGSAGDFLAQMVTDALITHGDAARQRGLAVLADTGRIATVTLRLPVLPETSVIQPGAFVRYADGLATRVGLSRSVSVDVQASADALTVWQSIRVETHE